MIDYRRTIYRITPLICSCLVLACLAIHAASFPPVPKDAPKKPAEKKAEKAPTLKLGETIWGNLTSDGINLEFAGHSDWTGLGEVLPKGKVRIIWTQTSNGQPCPGVYQIGEDGIMIGEWGYSGECRIELDGTMSGNTRRDTIWQRTPQPE